MNQKHRSNLTSSITKFHCSSYLQMFTLKVLHEKCNQRFQICSVAITNFYSVVFNRCIQLSKPHIRTLHSHAHKAKLVLLQHNAKTTVN